jgi:hypothetical protein
VAIAGAVKIAPLDFGDEQRQRHSRENLSQLQPSFLISMVRIDAAASEEIDIPIWRYPSEIAPIE